MRLVNFGNKGKLQGYLISRLTTKDYLMLALISLSRTKKVSPYSFSSIFTACAIPFLSPLFLCLSSLSLSLSLSLSFSYPSLDSTVALEKTAQTLRDLNKKLTEKATEMKKEVAELNAKNLVLQE